MVVKSPGAAVETGLTPEGPAIDAVLVSAAVVSTTGVVATTGIVEAEVTTMVDNVVDVVT